MYAARMRRYRSLKVFLPTAGEKHKAREHKHYLKQILYLKGVDCNSQFYSHHPDI